MLPVSYYYNITYCVTGDTQRAKMPFSTSGATPCKGKQLQQAIRAEDQPVDLWSPETEEGCLGPPNIGLWSGRSYYLYLAPWVT